jgi:hypothetical protein
VVTVIKVRVKFEAEPTQEKLDYTCDRIISRVDDFVSYRPRTFRMEQPSDEMINTGKYIYKWVINVVDAYTNCKELFDYINEEIPLFTLDVVDHKFESSYPQKYYWTNEGSTAYYDGGLYVDPYYTFHANDTDDYQIVYIPAYAKNKLPREKATYEKSGAKFMWHCTACRDNFMNAQTIEEAIEEFEEIYRNRLWNTIESAQARLTSATESFKQFDNYRRAKNGL